MLLADASQKELGDRDADEQAGAVVERRDGVTGADAVADVHLRQAP